MKRFFVALVVCVYSLCLFAQNKSQVEIYMKNGDVFRGVLVEQVDGQSYRLKADTGESLLLKVDDINKIVIDGVTLQPQEAKKLVSAEQPYQASARDQQAKVETNHKIPGLAYGLSAILPGLGQIYNGQVLKGIGFMVTSTALTVVALASMPTSDYYGYYGSYSSNSNENSTLFCVSLIAMVGIDIWSILDAGATAKRINEDHNMVNVQFKNSRLLLNPSIDCLRAQNGKTIPQSTNAGLKLTYAFGSR